NITGILAQMGRGMVQDVSDQMFQVFSQNIRTELESAVPTQPSVRTVATDGPAPTPPPAAAPAQAAALDLGAIGARAALRRPEVWVAVVAAAVVLYMLLR